MPRIPAYLITSTPRVFVMGNELGLKVADRVEAPVALEIEVTRAVPLTDREVAEVDNEATLAMMPTVDRVKAYHHEVARLTALGFKNIEIARITGRAPGTISTLQNSPMFRELVAHYHEKRDNDAMNLIERMEFMTLDALEAIHERLMDPEQRTAIGTDTLRKLAIDLADRVGLSPVSRSEVIHANVDINDISAIKSKVKTIEGKAEDSSGDSN